MKIVAGILAVMITASSVAHATPPSVSVPPSLAGEFEVVGTSAVVSITTLYGAFYRTECLHESWQGVTVLDRGTAIGVMQRTSESAKPGAAVGRQVIDCSNMDLLVVTTAFDNGRKSQAKWKRLAPHASVLPPPEESVVDPDHPPFGQSVSVDQVPQIVTQTEPIYPEKAKKEKVEGTVIVQAVVRRDGTVGDARVVRSVPGLDDAAIATVRQWRFKPAMLKDKTVAIWVAMPVRFILPKK